MHLGLVGRRSLVSLVGGVALALVASAFGQLPPVAAADDPPPVLGGQLFSTGGEVTIEVMPASAGLTSTLFLLEPEEVRIATNRDIGAQVTIGPYGRGEELVFGIRVSGQEFRLGPGARNPDGIEHAQVDFGPDGCAIVGFEDLFGGGDRDYDDNVFRFCGDIAPEDPGDPEEPPAPDPVRNPVADAGADQVVPEGSTVTLDGSGSKASTKPALQESAEAGTLPGGTSVTASMSGLDPDATGLRVQGLAGIGQGPPAQNTSIAYVIDVSGSTAGSGCGGDANGDGRSNTILDCEVAAALKLHDEVTASGTVDKVAVIAFNSGASALDLDPTSGTSTLVDPSADKDGDGVLDVVKGLKSLRIGGGTNFVPASRTSCQLLATTGSPNLITAFMSDGQGTGSLSTVLPCDPPVTFHAFAVGGGSRCNGGSAVGSRLIDMATLTGGTCTDVPTVTSLPDILPQVVASTLTSVSYSVDGGDPVDLSADLGLPVDGPADLDVAFDLPADLARGTHTVCLTVTGTDFGGTSSVTSCSDLVTVSGEVVYSWRVLSSEGPPIFLSSRATDHPSFVAADDGRYVFELTVSDGTGGTATDEVEVEVTNVDPEVALTHGDSFAGGVTQVNGTLTDQGWLDSHSARVDWGDGSVDTVDVTTAGPGWGTFFASHVYAAAGSFDVVVTLTDDDGGQDVARVDHLQVATPVAVWANAEGSPSLDWGGGSGSISGRVHTNGRLRFVGDRKSVRGPTTYAGALSADTTKNSFQPAPVQSGVQGFPYHPDIADFRPGGPVAAEVGADYHDMTDACVSGSWHEVQQVLDSGVYYAPCDVQLNGSDIGGRVTLVSEGQVKISGSKPAFEPYRDGLLLLAGSSGKNAIDISTSGSNFLGVLFAGSGEISVSGASNRFFCGILGDTISITGNDASVRGADCGRPENTVSGPVVVPTITSEITVDRDRALPSDVLGYDLTVTNEGATVVVPSLIGLENVDTAAAAVTGWSFAVEREDVATGAWQTVASRQDGTLSVHTRPNAFTGVTYPTGGGVTDTQVEPGGWATWGVEAVLELTPEEVGRLLDPARTGAVRTRVDFALDPAGVQARRLYTYGSDFGGILRDLGADATDARVTTILPDGDASVASSDDEPALARISAGESVSLARTWEVPVPALRADTETDAGYLARLLSQDGTRLNAAAFTLASGGVGRLVAPLTRAESTRELPVVGISTVGPEAVAAGTATDYDAKLANLGSADASDVSVEATEAGTSLPVTGAPAALAAGELGSGTFTYAPAADTSGSAVLRSTATWTDARGNAYGASGSSVDVTRQLPAAMQVSLTDAPQDDVAGDSVVSPGDTVRYAVTVRNAGGQPLAGVTGSLPAPTNGSFVVDSGRTPDGGEVVIADAVATFSLPDIAGGASRTVTVDIRVDDPFPAGVSRIQTQGTVTADGVETVLTDDPALPGAQDPTRTTVTTPHPALTATLGGRLAVDADGSGAVSPGDTLLYELAVSSAGTQQVTGIRIVVEPPAGTSLVAGSVQATQGTPASGASVDVAVGTLAPFQQTTVTFRLRVDNPLPSGVVAVTTVGTVTSDQLDPLTTDDPQTVTVGDTTTIPIGGSGGNPEVPGPDVASVSPEEGLLVTEPVHVTATLAPPAGETLSSWTVDYHVPGDPNLVVIGTGTGDQVDAVLDPTTMPNGAYVVTVRATSSNGGVTSEEVTVVVDGQMKLGRYTTTITDMTVGVGGVPVSVNRTYDSFDKTVGDFGVGWNLQLSNFRVSTNGPLGLGGWRMESCGGGLIFVPLCYLSDRPHFVTVTWPDGHNEVFDLRPARGSTFVSGLTSAEFSGRSGATSTLTTTDNSLWYSGGNLNGGFFGSDGVYDPTRFVLTAKGGTKYHLTVGVGLTKIVDPSGNVTTFGKNGVTSSLGPAITFDRDAQGRITAVTGPDGEQVGYAYDAAGDLVRVTDQRGNVVTLGYLAGHYLDTVEDPLGRPITRFEYADGRVVALVDGEGNRIELDSDVAGRQLTVTDPDGARTTISTFDEAGQLVRENQIYGGESHVTTYDYDGDNNLVYRKDPSGNVWRATYADGNLTSYTDPDGDRVAITWNDNDLPLTWIAPGGRVTTYDWNENSTLGSVTDALGHVESYTYNGKGQRTSRTDRNGETWQWTYHSNGQVATETDPIGEVTSYEYDAAGRQTARVDAEGNRHRWTYDEQGNTLSEVNDDGSEWRYAYDELGQLTRMVRPGGNVVAYSYDRAGNVLVADNHVDAPTSYTYDGFGRQTSVKLGDLPAATTTYDGAGNPLSMTDPLGRQTSYTYTDAGRPLTETNPAGGTTTYTYTPGGQLASVEDPAGLLTSYAYYPSGETKTVTDPSGRVTTSSYDDAGRLVRTTNPDGTETSMVYDDAGNLTQFVDEMGHALTMEYDEASRRVAMVDGEGRRSETGYDAAGRVISQTAPDGGVTSLTLTPGGLTRESTTPEGVTTRFTYDEAGRETSRTDGLGHTWSRTYDPLGRLLSQRDPRQQGGGPATLRHAYDGYGRLVSTADVLGNTVAFDYDAAGQRIAVTDPRGEVWETAYNALGQMRSETDPLGRTRVTRYDDAGRVTSRTDPRGVTIDLGYDAGGQLETMTERGGAGSVRYGYDDRGRRDRMTDSSGVTTWDYRPDGLLLSMTSPRGAVGYAYDDSGLRTQMTQPAGTVSYGYDLAGRLAETTDWNNETTTTVYDADGRLAEMVRPNGLTTTWSYDVAGRLTGLQHLRGGTVVDRSEYALDADGNRLSHRTADGTESYTYDAADQLSRVAPPAGAATTYTYDAAGNRTSATTGAAAPVTYDYDAASQMTSADGEAVTYDENGNVLTAGGLSFTWDWMSRMTSMSGAGETTTFGYDGDGIRVSQATGGVTAPLLWDTNTADGLPDLIAAGDTSVVQAPSGPIVEDGAETRYPLSDGNGSVRRLTDESGAVVGSTSYDVFGQVTATAGAESVFGFIGGQSMGLGLTHFPARDLAPQWGRFLSFDPVRPGAPGVVGWNPYAYVANNPATWTDPSGAFAPSPTAPPTTLPKPGTTSPVRGGGGPGGEYAMLLGIAIGLIPALVNLGWQVLKMYVLATAVVGMGSLACTAACTDPPSTTNGPDTEVLDDDEFLVEPTPEVEPQPTQQRRRQGCLAAVWGGSAIDYWPLDSLGRATGADACLKQPLTGGTGPGAIPVGWVPGMDRGHLIAARLGGRGIRQNLVPMYPYPNRGPMRLFEAEVAGLVDSEFPVYYVSIPVYLDNGGIPRGISLAYAKLYGPANARTILNVP